MIKVKDGYGKLIGTTYQGSATQVLLSNGGNLELSSKTKANTLVQRNASQHIYATYFNSAISDEALTDIGSVYVRNTSDTFIRRISKTQFYSIIDNKFVTLDTAQTITGVKTFSTGPILANNATITQNQNNTSNYTTVVKWLKGGTSQGTYNPSIGQHNTGGDGTGSICILPYPTSTDPLGGTVGLFIGKGVLRLDGKAVAIAENYHTKTESDKRYVNVTGDTMTGDLTMNNTKGFNIGWSTRVVKTSSVWIHGGSDAASSTDANLRFGSWQGIGWYPTFSGGSVAQGNNAMWLNVRTGVLDVHSNITSHNGYLAANWDSKRRLVLGGGSTYAWIDSRNSSNNVLCNIVLQDNKVTIGNYAESSRFVSTVGTGTAPYQCSSTTLNTNLNADLLDNWHIMDIPRNYNSAATYSLQFALGGTDNGWKKIFACAESGTKPYKSVTVWGRIWYAYGNHAQKEVRYYHFCAIFYMRSGPSSSNSSVGNVENSARLYLPTFAKGMDNIRLVRVGTNNFELQVRQIGSYHNGHIQYQYWAKGANVSAWRELQSTSNTSVAVSAGGASTLADSRASSADVWTNARTFYIQDHNAAHTGTGVSVNGSANVYLRLPNSIQCGDWFRSTGNSGWYHQDYGGGWYMSDSTWIRTYGSKSVYQDTGQIRTDGYLVTNGGLTAGATSPNNKTYKLHVTGASWSSGLIRAGGGFYHNSVNSNSYVLLAGGSYKSLADFAKGNAGASNRGVYVTNGTVTAMTYYLNATVNSGASGKLAYYRGTNSIDDYTNTIGSSSTPIYINNGVPRAANSYRVVNSGHYFSVCGISGYIYVIRYGQVVCVSINMSSGGDGSTGVATLLTNLPAAVYTTGQSASKGGGSSLRYATFYVSGTALYVYSYQANCLPNKVSFTYITNALNN